MENKSKSLLYVSFQVAYHLGEYYGLPYDFKGGGYHFVLLDCSIINSVKGLSFRFVACHDCQVGFGGIPQAKRNNELR